MIKSAVLILSVCTLLLVGCEKLHQTPNRVIKTTDFRIEKVSGFNGSSWTALTYLDSEGDVVYIKEWNKKYDLTDEEESYVEISIRSGGEIEAATLHLPRSKW